MTIPYPEMGRLYPGLVITPAPTAAVGPLTGYRALIAELLDAPGSLTTSATSAPVAAAQPDQMAAATSSQTYATSPAAPCAQSVNPVTQPIDGSQQRASDETRRMIAAEVQAEKRKQEIAESWKRAHARASAPFGLDKFVSQKANHGWAKIHADIARRHGSGIENLASPNAHAAPSAEENFGWAKIHAKVRVERRNEGK